MKRISSRVLAMTIATTFALAVLTAPAEAKTRGSLVVLGDSISAYYNNKSGSQNRAWWSYLASKTQLKPVVLAEGGSGFTRRGRVTRYEKGCQGTTLHERLQKSKNRAQIKKAKVVVIMAGVNDPRKCAYPDTKSRAEYTLAPTTKEEVSKAVRVTMREIKRIRGAKRMKSVYVTVPWGEHRPEDKGWVTSAVKAGAKKYRAQYVNTSSALTSPQRRKDHTHPNRAGSKALYNVFVKRSSILKQARAK